MIYKITDAGWIRIIQLVYIFIQLRRMLTIYQLRNRKLSHYRPGQALRTLRLPDF
jgi:hypothetical protein